MKPFEYPPPPECHTPPLSRTTVNGETFCSGCGESLNPLDLARFSNQRVSKQGIPSQYNNVPPRRPNNSFEKGRRLDERGVPYLDKAGKPLTMKAAFDKRKYDSSIRVGSN